MYLTFVDEDDFEKRGKWFFWSDNSSWEIGSTISVDTNDLLADISEFIGERESETNSESDSSWHDNSSVGEQQWDDDYTEEASTSGNRKGNSEKTKAKVSSGTQKGTRTKDKSARKTVSNDSTKGKPRKACAKKTKGKALTLKEVDDLVQKLDEKRPMCWDFVSEALKNQYVVKHYKTDRELIHEILDRKYNELRDLVLHMYSSYTKLVSAISKDVKKDRKAHLSLLGEKSKFFPGWVI